MSTLYGKYYDLLYENLISQGCNEKSAKCIRGNLEEEEVIIRLDENTLKDPEKVVNELLKYRGIAEAECGDCSDEINKPDGQTTIYFGIIIVIVAFVVGGVGVFLRKRKRNVLQTQEDIHLS